MGSICQCNNHPIQDVDLNNMIKPNLNLNNELLKTNLEAAKKKSSYASSLLGNAKYNKAKSVIPKDNSEYLTKNEYNNRVFELINKIRLNPSEYSKIIIENIKNIIYETHLIPNDETGEEEDIRICIFKKKVKVSLNRGESSFQEAAKYLETLAPMNKFKFKDKIVLPLPNNEKEFLDHKLIKKNANEFMKKNKINYYFHSYIKNPEVAVLMMIVNDTNNTNSKKRNYLLNSELKFIGINSKFIGKNFIACFSFS